MAKELDPTVSFRVPQDVLDRLDDLTLEKGYQFRTDLLVSMIATHPMFDKEPF